MADIIGGLTIETIDREIDGGFKTLVFSPELERRFEDGRRVERVRSFVRTGLIATVLYNLFLVSDAQMIPDVFSLAVFVRVGIYTPLFFVCWFVFTHSTSWRLREGIASALAIIAVLLIMYVVTVSRSPDMGSYQYGTVLIMLFSALVIRLRFRYAVTSLVVSMVIQLVAIANLHETSPRIMQTQVTFFVTAVVLMGVAAYVLEHEQRRGYLLGLRSALLNAQLDLAAKIDPLTGLGNRRSLSAVVDAAFANADSDAKTISAVLLDIDHFKSFNDAYGHQAGDRCLRKIGECVGVGAASFASATAIRFGGEEFLVVLDGADTAIAKKVALQIQASIASASVAHPKLGPGAIVTASVGIATIQTGQATFDDLIAAADKALYAAKASGRNCISVSPVTSRRVASCGTGPRDRVIAHAVGL